MSSGSKRGLLPIVLLLLGLALFACVFVYDVRVLSSSSSTESGGPHSPALPSENHAPEPAPRTADIEAMRRAFTPDRDYWGSDWVIVVTNYKKDLSWLNELPVLHLGMKLVIYVKQDESDDERRTCDMLPKEVEQHLFRCVEMPNAHGREAHTIAHFFVENYDRLPRMVVFLQVRKTSSAPRQNASASLESPGRPP